MELVFVYTESRFGPPHASLESVILELPAQSICREKKTLTCHFHHNPYCN